MTKIYSFQISIILVSLILPSTVLSYEPYFNWHIRIYRYNSFTQKEAQLYTLKFRDIYKNQDWMVYKIGDSGWECRLSTRTGEVFEGIGVHCSRDGFVNIVYHETLCAKGSDDFLNGGLSFTNSVKGEMIFTHIGVHCYM